MTHAHTIVAVAAAGYLAALLGVGCSSTNREDVLSTVFDGVVPESVPPRRRTRRDLLREIEDLKRELAQAKAGMAASQEEAAPKEPERPIEQAKTWEAAAELLPKDADGNVDWDQALKDGAIGPRPGADPNAKDEDTLQLDVERIPADGEMFKAVFSHEVHTVWLACASCHPEPFQMAGGATPMSMEQINGGQGCGLCHGTVAFPATSCGPCHPAMGG